MFLRRKIKRLLEKVSNFFGLKFLGDFSAKCFSVALFAGCDVGHWANAMIKASGR
jgi:hypothetical protein